MLIQLSANLRLLILGVLQATARRTLCHRPLFPHHQLSLPPTKTKSTALSSAPVTGDHTSFRATALTHLDSFIQSP